MYSSGGPINSALTSFKTLTNHTGSLSELLWGRNCLRSLALAGGVAVHAVNVYIVTSILPSIVADIGGLEYYACNTTLFVVASILGSALSPKSIDRKSTRLNSSH